MSCAADGDGDTDDDNADMSEQRQASKYIVFLGFRNAFLGFKCGFLGFGCACL